MEREFCSKKMKKKLYDAFRYLSNPNYYLEKANDWKSKNPNRVKENKHNWYLDVKPEHNAKSKLRHQLHREEDNKNSRDRYYKNREVRIQQSLKYQRDNPDKVNANHRSWNHEHPEQNLAYHVKSYEKMAKESKMTRSHYRRTLQVWSEAIKVRDKYICQWCGSTVKCEAHHILPKNDFIDERFIMSNGITLCEPCHDEAHRLHKQV